jgi:hypothetical protein
MQCNIIAQRISLQEFLTKKFEEIEADIDNFTEGADPEKLILLTSDEVHKMLDNWLAEFELVQPS